MYTVSARPPPCPAVHPGPGHPVNVLLRRVARHDITEARSFRRRRPLIFGCLLRTCGLFKNVMMRLVRPSPRSLHSYVQEGKPYPNWFTGRCGPGRPPPPNPHLRTASRTSVSGDVIALANSASILTGSNGSASASDLDKPFAKLILGASSTPDIERAATDPQTGLHLFTTRS